MSAVQWAVQGAVQRSGAAALISLLLAFPLQAQVAPDLHWQ